MQKVCLPIPENYPTALKCISLCTFLSLTLSACKTYYECDCGEIGAARAAELQTEDQTGEVRRVAQLELRLRGTKTLQPLYLGESEHPAPLYPHLINPRGNDDSDIRRLLRDFPRTVDTPVRYGLLYAHTLYSDESGTFEEAFERARDKRLDFLVVTPNNHSHAELGTKSERRDVVLIAKYHDLMNASDDVKFTRTPRINGVFHSETLTSPSLSGAAENTTNNDFSAIVRQEFSSISSGNHVNVLGRNEVSTVPNGGFSGFYSAFSAHTPVLQMNHPNVHWDFFYRGSNQSTINRMFNDYGLGHFGENFFDLVEAADHLLVLIELATAPAFAKTSRERFYYKYHERDNYYCLIQDFHIRPSAGHDNHFKTWGDATPARMGIVSDVISQKELFAVMQANRTFAAEDSDLRVGLIINEAGMGDVLELAADENLKPRLIITDDTDLDSKYSVELIYGDVQPQSWNNLAKWVPDDGLSESWTFAGPGELTSDQYIASGVPEFIYVRVT